MARVIGVSKYCPTRPFLVIALNSITSYFLLLYTLITEDNIRTAWAFFGRLVFLIIYFYFFLLEKRKNIEEISLTHTHTLLQLLRRVSIDTQQDTRH